MMDACSDSSMGLAVAVLMMALCGVAFAVTRANAVKRTFVTSRLLAPSSLELVHAVARVQRKRMIVLAVVCIAGVDLMASVPVQHSARAIMVIGPSLLLACSLVALARVQRLLELRGDSNLRIGAHGHYLFAARGTELVGWAAAPPRLVANAIGLPAASVRGYSSATSNAP